MSLDNNPNNISPPIEDESKYKQQHEYDKILEEIQFKHNKELEEIRLNNEKIKICYDKLIIGIIIGVFMFVATVMLELYKDRLSSAKYNYEMKTTAISEIKTAYANMSEDVANMLKQNRKPCPEIIRARTAECSKMVRKWSVYLSQWELRNFSACIWNYIALENLNVSQWDIYYSYFSRVDENFRLICREAVDFKMDDDYFEFTDIQDNYDTTSTESDFLNKNFDRWNNMKRSHLRNLLKSFLNFIQFKH